MTITSSLSYSMSLSELSNVTETSAKFICRLSSVPPKITSSMRFPRIDFEDTSPSTQRIASDMFDFPLPFGPTTTVAPTTESAPPAKFRTVRSGNDLKPNNSRDLRYMGFSSVPSAICQTDVSSVNLPSSLYYTKKVPGFQ